MNSTGICRSHKVQWQPSSERMTRSRSRGERLPTAARASDTGELLWEVGGKRTGRLTIDTPRIQAAVGWSGGQTVRTADGEIRLRTPFCAVSLAALDGQPLVRSKKILLWRSRRWWTTTGNRSPYWIPAAGTEP